MFIRGYPYIKPRISLFSDPNNVCCLPNFYPFPTRVRSPIPPLCHAVVDGPASILPKVGRDSAVPLAETSEKPGLSGERMESETVLTVMIPHRNIYDECHWILGLF